MQLTLILISCCLRGTHLSQFSSKPEFTSAKHSLTGLHTSLSSSFKHFSKNSTDSRTLLLSTFRMLSFASFMCCNGFNELGLETILLFKCKTESKHKCYIQVNRHTFGRRFLVELGANDRPDAPAMQELQGENRMIGELSQVQLRMRRAFCFVQSQTKEYVQQVAHHSYWNPSKTQLNQITQSKLKGIIV